MGERLLCKQEVIGSIPFTSTTATAKPWRGERQAQRCCAESGRPGVAFSRRSDRSISLPRRLGVGAWSLTW